MKKQPTKNHRRSFTQDPWRYRVRSRRRKAVTAYRTPNSIWTFSFLKV